jgi:hypothetical protein
MTMPEPYRQEIFPNDEEVQKRTAMVVADILQWSKDEGLKERIADYKIIKSHLARIALENNGLIPLESAYEILDGILAGEL